MLQMPPQMDRPAVLVCLLQGAFPDGAHVLASPTDIHVTGGPVYEAALPGTLVAVLTAIDPDANDTCTFVITGDASGFFEIIALPRKLHHRTQN